jgi:hypothetical protein
MSNTIKTKANALTDLVDFEVLEYAYYLSHLQSAVEFVDIHIEEADEVYTGEERRRACIEFVLANMDTLISDMPEQLYNPESSLYQKLITIFNENF